LCIYLVPDSVRISLSKDGRHISSTSSSSSKVLRNLFIHDKCECTKARRYITIFRPLCQCGCPVWVRVFLLFQSTYTFLELGLKPSKCLLLYYVDRNYSQIVKAVCIHVPRMMVAVIHLDTSFGLLKPGLGHLCSLLSGLLLVSSFISCSCRADIGGCVEYVCSSHAYTMRLAVSSVSSLPSSSISSTSLCRIPGLFGRKIMIKHQSERATFLYSLLNLVTLSVKSLLILLLHFS
jgi:hypothetical protein